MTHGAPRSAATACSVAAQLPAFVSIGPGAIVVRDEGSRRTWQVELSAFEIATVPVTVELWHSVVPRDADPSDDPRAPIRDVSWIDAVEFCNRLSERQGLRPCYSRLHAPDAVDVCCDWAANGYRLPSEAEWEYACRAGTTTVRYGELGDIAWYRDNADQRVHPVATKQANAWGLYDTMGNVWEWCWDHFDPRVYGPYRVFRGGGWMDVPRSCRASCRRKSHPTFRIDDLGFRLAKSVR